MSKRTDSAIIGAFVIGALALVVAAILVWGSGRLLRKTAQYVCYFDGSVNGLASGAPVKVRGVTIGQVVRIQLRYRQRPIDRRIPVFIEVDVDRMGELGGPPLATPEALSELIARGLRARLESQSILTGTLFINLGLFPDRPIVMSEVDPAHGYPEIPTMPTELAEVGESATAFLGNLQSVDFAGLARSIAHAASSVDRLASGEASKVLAEAVATLQSYRQLALHLDAGLTPLTAQLQGATEDARKTLVGLDGAAGSAGRLLAPQAPLSVGLSEALTDVDRAAKAVRELADYLRRNPNALIVGKGQ